ncbi:MAG: ABC transporter permease subunit [Oscillospiraceae bacterium]
MAVAPEAIAGEKERGTIATLLITPAKRGSIALGKSWRCLSSPCWPALPVPLAPSCLCPSSWALPQGS